MSIIYNKISIQIRPCTQLHLTLSFFMEGKGNQEENKMSLEAAGLQGGTAHEANDGISHSSAIVSLPGFPPH